MRNLLRTVFPFEKGEALVAILLFAYFFLAIGVFQILRPLKNGLFIEKFGANVELYAKLGNIAVAALGVAAFSWLYNHLRRDKVVYSMCGFLIAAFVLFRVLLVEPADATVWGFYFTGDLVSTLMVSAFWAYATDVCTTEQAKRLFGVVGAGGVIGGWTGITFAKVLLKQIGMNGLLLACCVMLAMVCGMVWLIEHSVNAGSAFRQPTLPEPKQDAAGGSGTNPAIEGAKLVFQSPYLLAIVGIMGFYEISSQLMDYQFKLATEQLSGVAETQAYMTNVYFYANVLSVCVQLFLVSVIIRKLGVTSALMVLPLAMVASSIGFFVTPTLFMASFLVVSDNGLNYSIQQTARESLYLITTPDEKYKARAFTNMFVQRVAKGVCIFMVIGLTALSIGVRPLSFLVLVSASFMIACSIYAGRHFSKSA